MKKKLTVFMTIAIFKKEAIKPPKVFLSLTSEAATGGVL